MRKFLKNSRAGLFLCLALTGAFAAGCATTGGAAATGGAGGVTVLVKNNLVPAAEVTIYAAPEGGSRYRIGSVPAAAERTVTFRPTGGTGRYVLRAVTTSGATVNSNPITVFAGSSVVWDLQSNFARVQ